ncbi:UNVERIFIED_CONTAM: hypothetical protein GTU68_062162 [Idotea baltica]|nr:hypothetical protein [Idotea baltica]
MNHLAKEKSPYLLQHQNNPVHWWAWGLEAIEEARKLDKPIFLSIGYSTCYWCHVMEGECFEDAEVAAYLNENFISIKIDREERPDIDAIYMEAVVAISGQGGWPLSAFLDAELKPFFGGTYFPKENFMNLLKKLHETWKDNRPQIKLASSQLYEVLQSTSRSTAAHELGADIWQQAFVEITKNFDRSYGGFGAAPKFPASGTIRFLLRYYRRFNDQSALEMAQGTLEAMARGGLYDQVGGGFHRYSTDAQWLVPHFEKMLYDNALLVPAYLECWQLCGEEFMKEIAQSTLEYMLREMCSEQGAFYSAQDAGIVGREGEFYVWAESELEDLLEKDEFVLLKEVFEITAAGNFESGMSIPRLRESSSWEQRYSEPVNKVISKLLAIRDERKKPHLDDKVLTSWNALSISAFCKGYQILGVDKYLTSAQQAASFIKDNLYQDGELLRRYRQGDSRFNAYLEDYSFLIQALLDLYQCDSDVSWLNWAIELQRKSDALFWDTEGSGYFSTSDRDETVIVRKKEHSDNALPSASAVAASNLFRLSYLSVDTQYSKQGHEALAAFSGLVKNHPIAFSYTLMALEFEHYGALEVVISAAKDSELIDLKKEVFGQFQPTLVLVSGEPGAASSELPKILENREAESIYICVNGACQPALKDVDSAIKEIRRSIMQ